jgi:hypothetical protein
MTSGWRGPASTAAVAVALAAVLVLGALTATPVLVLAVLLAQGLFAAGWFAGLRVPSPRGGLVVVAAAGAGADIAVLAGDDTRPLAHVAPVLGLALLAAFAHQLLRRDGRVELTVSLTATGTAAVLAGLASAWLALDVSPHGDGLLVVAAVAAAAPAVIDLVAGLVSGPRWVAAVAAAAVTLLASGLVAGSTEVGTPVALAAGAGGAVAARLAALLAERAPTPQVLLTAALPAALVAPVVYLLGRVLVG